jgi:hypothetical protein
MVPGDKLFTIGAGNPVIGSMGDRAGDHKGHRVLNGGRATQFWAIVNDERHKMKRHNISKRITYIFIFCPLIFIPSLIQIIMTSAK